MDQCPPCPHSNRRCLPLMLRGIGTRLNSQYSVNWCKSRGEEWAAWFWQWREKHKVILTMKEYPILFSGEMVQAILDGRKTQTRRVINPQSLLDNKTRVTACYECPYGAPGDSLWVRESCQIYGHWVKNGHTKSGAQRWKFSIHASKQVLYAGSFVKSPSNKTNLS